MIFKSVPADAVFIASSKEGRIYCDGVNHIMTPFKADGGTGDSFVYDDCLEHYLNCLKRKEVLKK